jgi:tripartite-type tricarboxylate transporter receptor subunit TctC
MVKTSSVYSNPSRYIWSLLLTLLLLCGVDKLWAQSFPTKPIRLVIPYAVGGSTDQTGRLLAKYLTQKLGQPVVPENRAGAGGALGHEVVAKSAPDGYTLLFSAAGPLTVTPHTYPRLNYDPIQGFDFITLIAVSYTHLRAHET